MKIYQQKGNKSLLILNHKTSVKVLINNVILIKGDINYSIFYMKNGQSKLVSHTIKFFETHLETHGFLRIHRGYMINPNYVKTYNLEKKNSDDAQWHNCYDCTTEKAYFKGFLS